MGEATEKQKRFKNKCMNAATRSGVDVEFFDDSSGDGLCHDDGNLHITRHGVHAAFDVACHQSLPGAEQNKNTRNVMTAMAYSKLIDDRVLVEEDDNEDDDGDDGYCPHCGRG